MNQVRIFAYGIVLGSLVWGGFNNYQSRTLAAIEEQTLRLVANGEDFVRQGFVSKDGWQIDFEHLDVNFSNATAYATETAFKPQKGDTKASVEFEHQAEFAPIGIIDLAKGGADAEPIVVAETTVPTGFYNALVWELSTAQEDSPIAGNTMVLEGQATKNGEIIDFKLGFNRPIEYVCGEFVGDDRLGIVKENEPGQVEATLHFDHIFGDADTPPEDALNRDALGFQPLAQLASQGMVELNDADFAEQLSEADYQKLTEAIAGLGHVGEGHCVIGNSQ